MAEAEVEAFAQRLAGRLGALGGVPGGLENLARESVELLAAYPGLDRGACMLVGVESERVQSGDGVADLAAHERPRHVGPAARLLVLRPQVDLDRNVRRERPRTRLMADRRARAPRL